MGVIFIKHRLKWIWKQCVHIHRTNINYHTGKGCCIVLQNVHILIPQVKNQIIKIQKHFLQYVFVFINYSTNVWCMLDAKKMSLAFQCSSSYARLKTINNKRAFNDVDICCRLMHKFLHSINSKAIISLTTCPHPSDKSLW